MFWNLFRRNKNRDESSIKRRKDGTLEYRMGHTVPGSGADLASTDSEVIPPSR